MRIYVLTLTYLIYSAVLSAQDVFSNRVNSALEKVLKDFPNRFHNIKGELVAQESSTTEYRSMIQLPGAVSCRVTRVSNRKKDSYCWSCIALQTEDFNLAKYKFKEIYGQIENTIIKIEGEKPFILNGPYETPAEDRKETHIFFDLLPAVGDIKNVRVELTLQSESRGWKISLLVSDQERKYEGQGALTNN